MAVSEAGEDVKLLGHWASIFVTRVMIALKLKGVAHEFLEEVIGSNGELAKSELLLNSNPVYKKIPVLLHCGKPVCESMLFSTSTKAGPQLDHLSFPLTPMSVRLLAFGLLT